MTTPTNAVRAEKLYRWGLGILLAGFAAFFVPGLGPISLIGILAVALGTIIIAVSNVTPSQKRPQVSSILLAIISIASLPTALLALTFGGLAGLTKADGMVVAVFSIASLVSGITYLVATAWLVARKAHQFKLLVTLLGPLLLLIIATLAVFYIFRIS